MKNLIDAAVANIANFISKEVFGFKLSKTHINNIYEGFQRKYGPEKLSTISDNDLLNDLFINVTKPESLCSTLETDLNIWQRRREIRALSAC